MFEHDSPQMNALRADLQLVIRDAEEVLRATADEAGDDIKDLRSRMQANVLRAKSSLAQLSRAGVEKVRYIGQQTDGYVHENPWKSIAAGASIGMLLGVLLSRR